MSDSESSRPNVLGSLRRALDTVLAILENRLRLITVEFNTEKYRLVELLVLAICAACFGVMSVVMVTITLLLLVPEDNRIHVLGGASLLCGLATAWAVLRLRHRLKSPPPFSDTLIQLKKDREWFTTKK